MVHHLGLMSMFFNVNVYTAFLEFLTKVQSLFLLQEQASFNLNYRCLIRESICNYSTLFKYNIFLS